MLKIIKKTISILFIPGAVLISVPVALLIILRIPYVQTSLARGVTEYISNNLNTTVSVGSIEFSYFNKLTINNILIKDQNRDTLFYSPMITAGLRQFNPVRGVFSLGRVNVIRPVFALITDSSNVMNLSWYLEKISSSGGDTIQEKGGGTRVDINQIDIKDGRFALLDYLSAPSDIAIDFNKLRISGINGSVEDLTINSDSIAFDIKELSFTESNGFIAKKIDARLAINSNSIVFRDVNLVCDSSTISSRIVGMYADSMASFGNFLKEVKLDLDINKSAISSADLKYFVPFIKGYNESFWLSGRITGTVSELKGRDVNVSYGDNTRISCDFDLSGLPDIQNTFIFLEVNDFRSASGDIEQLNIPGKGKILLPEPLRKLGIVSFSGTFTGFTTDFVTYGKINTDKGLISTDVSLRPEGNSKFKLNGLIKGTDIDLGSLTGNTKMLDKMTFEANVNGYTDSFKRINAQLTGSIGSIMINNYNYRDIDLTGSFTDKAWNGNIKVDDKNIKMDLAGMFDFNNVIPEFDFTLNLKKASLYRLNIDRSDTSSSVSLLLTANFKGDNIDNLDGEIRLLNSSFRKYSNDLEIYDFSLKTFTENSKPAILLRTDFIDASLYGSYNFAGMSRVVKNIMAKLVPAKYSSMSSVVKQDENDFIFDIKLKDTERLNKFFRTGLSVSKNSAINGMVKSDSLILLTGNAKMFSSGNMSFSDFSIEASYVNTVLNAEVKGRSLDLSGLTEMKELNLQLKAFPDSFNLGLYWDNKEKILNKGSFQSTGIFSRSNDDTTSNKSILRIKLLPGEIYARNNLWKIYPSEIRVDSNAVKFDRFSIRNNDNYMLADGSLSEDPADTINLKFNGISLSPLNNLYEKGLGNPSDIIHLAIGGTLNGRVSLTDVYRNFMFQSDIRLKDFTLLESRYGEIKILSVWNNIERVVDINATNDLEGTRMFNITGTYDPASRNMNLTADADKLPVDALNPLISFFASDISGTATGRVNLSGELSHPLLTGSLLAENATIKIDYIQTKYTFTDSIRFDKSGIRFNNIQFRDEKGNTAILNGTVFHNSFQDFSVDLNLKTNECMVLNTKSKDNEMFYGTAFASGLTSLKSTESLLRFDISAKTGKNTKFFIPLNTGSSVSENTFISFMEPARNDSTGNTGNKKTTAESSGSTAIEMAFDLQITPDAECQLIMDPKIGDIIKGKGSGNLNISMDRKGILKVFGDYTIETGNYLFTLGNIINKEFDVESGGQVNFNGVVDNAEMNIKAIYRTKAALSEINPVLFADVKHKERIPVECHLMLTGRLFNPVVAFDIYLPTADEETRAYLKSMIKSEEDMSRQFLFLLVMGSFYADQSATSQPNIGSSAVGLTTMEMLSNQLSNWLSQISKDFDIGVAYRPGSANLSNSDELQVALSTQILNDKVIINGNFDVVGATGTTGNQTNPGTSTITGDFDIEYKINEKIRFKVFNRSNDNFYIDNGIQYTQGIGIFYRQDYNKLKDIFVKKQKGDMKKEDETKPNEK